MMMDESAVAALALYAVGLHVFPVPLGSKEPFGFHKMLEWSRLRCDALADLCTGRNLAVRVGRLSDNLFVIDCDCPEDADRTRAWLAAHGIAAWERTSARGAQFWMLCGDGEVANGVLTGEHDWQNTQVKGRLGYALVPPSVHPTGLVLEWATRAGERPPTVSLDDLAGLIPLRLVGRRRDKGERPSTLPRIADKVLIQRDTSGYKSNSEAERRACLSLIETHW